MSFTKRYLNLLSEVTIDSTLIISPTIFIYIYPVQDRLNNTIETSI